MYSVSVTSLSLVPLSVVCVSLWHNNDCCIKPCRHNQGGIGTYAPVKIPTWLGGGGIFWLCQGSITTTLTAVLYSPCQPPLHQTKPDNFPARLLLPNLSHFPGSDCWYPKFYGLWLVTRFFQDLPSLSKFPGPEIGVSKYPGPLNIFQVLTGWYKFPGPD